MNEQEIVVEERRRKREEGVRGDSVDPFKDSVVGVSMSVPYDVCEMAMREYLVYNCFSIAIV